MMRVLDGFESRTYKFILNFSRLAHSALQRIAKILKFDALNEAIKRVRRETLTKMLFTIIMILFANIKTSLFTLTFTKILTHFTFFFILQSSQTIHPSLSILLFPPPPPPHLYIHPKRNRGNPSRHRKCVHVT
jgi:hypothetical protein